MFLLPPNLGQQILVIPQYVLYWLEVHLNNFPWSTDKLQGLNKLATDRGHTSTKVTQDRFRSPKWQIPRKLIRRPCRFSCKLLFSVTQPNCRGVALSFRVKFGNYVCIMSCVVCCLVDIYVLLSCFLFSMGNSIVKKFMDHSIPDL